jgi:hypothetical protein
MPKPEIASRIIANEFPLKTYSQTVFDLPLRKDVIQTQIPNSTTRTFETKIDPRFPRKGTVSKVNGILYHNTGSSASRINNGIESFFLENKSSKKKLNRFQSNKHHLYMGKKFGWRKKDFIFEDNKKFKEFGLQHARKAYETSSAMLDSFYNPTPSMILDIKILNKREQPDIRLYENNQHAKQLLNEMRRTPAGVRAANTIRRLQ